MLPWRGDGPQDMIWRGLRSPSPLRLRGWSGAAPPHGAGCAVAPASAGMVRGQHSLASRPSRRLRACGDGPRVHAPQGQQVSRIPWSVPNLKEGLDGLTPRRPEAEIREVLVARSGRRWEATAVPGELARCMSLGRQDAFSSACRAAPVKAVRLTKRIMGLGQSSGSHSCTALRLSPMLLSSTCMMVPDSLFA